MGLNISLHTLSTEQNLPVLQLSNAEIQIWQTSLEATSATVTRLTQLLSLDEQERARRFYFERDRRRYIVARGTLRQLLGGYLHCAPSIVRFTYAAQGKPSLASQLPEQHLHFNVSHSHESALFAFAWNREVGVDIEAIRSEVEIEGIFPTISSPEEQADWKNVPASTKRPAFFSLWSRKEALVKAIGQGIGYPLQEVTVGFSENLPQQIRLARTLYAQSQQWQIWELPVESNLRAALAI
ncbi:MAG: 4'-phosphopantetheinyl transferase superfamily protein [Caldilineaceae bacterium]